MPTLGERDVVLSHADLIVAALGHEPGAMVVEELDSAIEALS